jgi:hypothetical protein
MLDAKPRSAMHRLRFFNEVDGDPGRAFACQALRRHFVDWKLVDWKRCDARQSWRSIEQALTSM